MIRHLTHRLRADETDRAAEILARGGTVAIPTETVYGLGADASNDEAVAKIFEAKGRPAGHPLIVHLASSSQLGEWTTSHDRRVRMLADAFWPGPLTLILPRTDRVSELAVGGRNSVGVRVPEHPVAHAVLTAFGGGVAAPSANRFGHVSPTSLEHVLADLDGRIDAVIEGGTARVGVESTIVELVGDLPVLLRPGGVSVAQLEAVLGEEVIDGRSSDTRAAGMLASHYAPMAEVEIVESVDAAMLERAAAARDERGDELARVVGVIGPVDIQHAHVWWLPESAGDYAEGLYASLRAADAAGVDRLLVVPPRHGELLEAVLDRLHKAAAERPDHA